MLFIYLLVNYMILILKIVEYQSNSKYSNNIKLHCVKLTFEYVYSNCIHNMICILKNSTQNFKDLNGLILIELQYLFYCE